MKAANSMIWLLPVAKESSLFVTGGMPRITMNRDDPTIAAVLTGFMHLRELSNLSCTSSHRFFSTKTQMKSLSI